MKENESKKCFRCDELGVWTKSYTGMFGDKIGEVHSCKEHLKEAELHYNCLYGTGVVKVGWDK